jgi:hypothetical protein
MMKKILNLLEKYVQWGTLAIGAAFLGWMIWSYIFVNPAAKSLNVGGGAAEIVTPGNVDHVIVEGPAAQLDGKIHVDNSAFQLPMPPEPKLDINNPTTQPLPAVALAYDSWQLDLDKNGSNGPSPTAQVQGLPGIPPAHYLDNEPLRTILAVTDAAGNVTTHDQDAVTTFWSLPMADLANAYVAPFAAKLPPSQQRVYFAHADLVRQEQLADGSWGNDKIVADRIFNENSPPRPPYPAPDDPAAVADTYRNWLILSPNQRSIVNADFPAVSAQNHPELQWQPLDAWVAFRAKQQAEEAAPIPSATPTTPITPNPVPLNPRPIVQPQPQQLQQQQQPGSFGGQHAYGLRQVTGSGMLTIRSGSNGQWQMVGPAGGAPLQPITPVRPPSEPVFGAAPATAPSAAATPAPVQFTVPTLPKLQLVPATDFTLTAIQDGGDIELYFHDLTVQDGKTYRYKVRYSLLNPVYEKPNQVSDAKLAKVLAIDSPDSEWSAAVSVPPRTKFWCSAKQPSAKNGTVAFSVFSWHDGKWDEKDYPEVAPGDEIGDGNFVTHWTLLDTRSPRTSMRLAVIVADDGGSAQQRNVQTDGTSHEFQRMMSDFQALTAGQNGNPNPGAAAPGANAPPGPAPGGMLPGT